MADVEGNPSSTGSPDGGTPSPASGGAPATPASGGTPATPAAPATGSWLDSLPEELRSSKSLSKFDSVHSLAQGYVNAEQLIGREKLPVPKTDEEYMAVYDRLGRPKTPEDYGLSIDGAEYNPQLKDALQKDLAWFKSTAHQIGLSSKQAEALFNGYLSNTSENMRQVDANIDYEMAAAEATLQKDFGRDYKRNVALANRALSFYGSENLVKAVEASGLGRNPDFVKMMHKIGMERHEEIGIDKGGISEGKSTAAALEEAMSDPAYADATHPNHKKAVARVTMLFSQSHPD